MTGLAREDGRAIGEHAIDLVAKCGEHLPDAARLAYLGSTAVWALADGGVAVVTLEREFE